MYFEIVQFNRPNTGFWSMLINILLIQQQFVIKVELETLLRLLVVLFKISDEHPCPFYVGAPPGVPRGVPPGSTPLKMFLFFSLLACLLLYFVTSFLSSLLVCVPVFPSYFNFLVLFHQCQRTEDDFFYKRSDISCCLLLVRNNLGLTETNMKNLQ